mmetsp:Transcript_11740/g.22327  ORF Transcript_11740/g.22327 Transcript_11740/m.22327 type:complete len:136 (+) Transcript_11740:88-495(+)|eukprot:CAMPEP_0114225778 /NCGR_PEP_ID=MMETSP0058-20121206/859_1 /TAXON_ID=36894 /ORGANISM="Pyramimonas parkeae, CCMP726" /LENGTH=135 /DNA_ID=CAMNT_0001336417 /DNA_START=87 /DNA_END=494 /DNA_ORIENTATION=+
MSFAASTSCPVVSIRQNHSRHARRNESSRRSVAVQCSAVDQKRGAKMAKRAAQASALVLAAFVAQTPEAHAAATELFQLAHEHEDFGPTPFWVYPMLAIPAPTVVYLMLSGSLGETGTHYLDGSNTPVGQPKKEE